MDLVTAVITTYQRDPEIVERALKSVVAQTYQNIEIIIVDDSPDTYARRSEVRDLARVYQEHCDIRYIAHETPMGGCAARNTGLRNANGKYIAFLDDDDEWLPEKTEKQIRQFVRDDIALVYCWGIWVYDETGEKKKAEARERRGNVFDELISTHNFLGPTSFVMMNTELLRSIGGFDPEMPSAQDFDVWLRLTKKYPVGLANDYLVYYHVHQGDQITKHPEKKVAAYQKLIEKHGAYLRENPAAYWAMYSYYALMLAMSGRLREALQAWGTAANRRPGEMKENVKNLARIVKYVSVFRAKKKAKG